MRNTRKPQLGLCPIGKFVFSHEDAIRYKEMLQAKLRSWEVSFVDLEGVLPDGLVRDARHVDPVVEHFRRQGIDALFVPHCNFGTESAVGNIARRLDVPTLLWGPRDEAPLPDGARLRDTLCGLLATSKVLHKLGVPFTYLANCRIDDPTLARGVDRFLRAANVANALRRGLRIGCIGQRIDFFWSTIISESELLERFHIELLPIDLVEFIRNVRQRAVERHDAYLREAAQLRREAEIVGFANDEPLVNIFAVRDQMLALVETHGLHGLAVQDYMSLMDEMGAYCYFANSLVSEECVVSCESDVLGAVSSILLSRAIYDAQPVFLADITVRHPEDDNGVLLWHAGAAPSLKHSQATVRLAPHWILPSPLAGMTHFPLKPGPITMARFDGDRGQYRLAVGEGESMDGPFTQNNYLWLRVDNWPRWERLLMEGPFLHHVAMCYSPVGEALVEACRYIPGLEPVQLNSARSG